jgi:hypothetical protein
MESLAKDDMCDVETDSEIIAIKTGISNRDTQPEIPCDEVCTWARRAVAANGFGDY